MNEEAIFHAALAKPPEERAAFLEQACAGDAALRQRVDILLEAHANPGSFLGQPPAHLPSTVDAPAEHVGTVVASRYKLLEQIGEGGMGTVWVAEQTHPVRRKVAVKLVKAGMDSKTVLSRFEAERQALALMDHPNIAKVLDGGTTESSRPFFVMEYVKGIPLTKYCDDGRLSVAERLALFVPVCNAVQHAHQKGIIHRDLKPSNILVCLYDGQPVPKVIDFGLAKAIHQPLTEHTLHTAHGLMMGTPLYMSPEQAELNNLDVDTRTDIYALGVILYELLTGTTPLERQRFKEAAWLEMLRFIKEEEPPKPSDRLSSSGSLPSVAAQRKLEPAQLTKLVRGELDWIVMKALEKERTRRYETANGFARDIQRYLADEPVEACPPSASYRLRKFARKNRVALTMAAVVFGLVIMGAIVSTWLAIWAVRAEGVARDAESQAAKDRDEAKKQQKEAVKQSRIANEREEQAIQAMKAREAVLHDLKYNLALDQVLLAKAGYDNGDVPLASERLTQVPPELRRWEWRYLDRLCAGGIFTLYGHKGGVTCVDFSPDGTRLVTGSLDKTAKVWDARTGEHLLDLLGHTDPVYGVAFSPDGARIATSSQDRTAKIWDARTGAELIKVTGRSQRISTVAFSPDGTRLLTASNDGIARVWDANTGAQLLELKGHTNIVKRAVFSPDGTRIATAGFDNLAKVWDAKTGAHLLDLKGHESMVRSVAFSPDGKRLATAGHDHAVKVWDAESGLPLLQLKQGNASACVAFSPDGKWLAAGSFGGIVDIWNAHSGVHTLDLKAHGNKGKDPVMGVTFSPDGQRLATASQDGTAKVWSERDGTPMIKFQGAGSTTTRFAPHGASDATSALVTFIYLGVDFSPDGARLVTAGYDQSAQIWDARTGSLLIHLKAGHTDGVLCAAFSPDGKRFVSGGPKAIVRDAATGTPVLELKTQRGISSVAYSRDGERILAAFAKTTFIYDARSGEQLLTIGTPSEVFGLTLSPDGTRIATAHLDDRARIWDARDGKLLLVCKGHTHLVTSVAFSPDGTRLLTGSYDTTAKIWDVATGTCTHNLKGHGEQVSCVAFSPDGTRVATGSYDTTAKIWDGHSGTPLMELKGHQHDLHALAFSPDGTRLATASRDGTVTIWDAPVRAQTADTIVSPEERAYRLFWTRTRPDWLWEDYRKAKKDKDAFAADSHINRLLSYCKQSIAQNPRDAQPHLDLGAALYEKKDLDGAVAAFRQALACNPKLVDAYMKLAKALADKSNWDAALEAGGQALALEPWDITLWNLTSPLKQRGRYLTAARLNAAAFAAHPKLANFFDIFQNRYNAACYAALAASGKGTDAEALDDSGRGRWRRQALDWLRADLAAYEKPQTPPKTTLLARLKHWQKDTDLISIRDQDAVAKLPAEERAACQKLWADVEAILKVTEDQVKAEALAKQKTTGGATK